MIRLRIADQLAKKGWTAYRLAKEAGITITVAYRLTNPAGGFKRIDLDTLDAICRALGCQPGDLLRYVPSKGKRT